MNNIKVLKNLWKRNIQLIADTKIDPIFNRDGWYYDRYKKISWIEDNGIAYTSSTLGRQFLHELETLNTKVLSDTEMKAIETLIIYGSSNKEIEKLLYKNMFRLMTQNIIIRSKLARMEILGR